MTDKLSSKQTATRPQAFAGMHTRWSQRSLHARYLIESADARHRAGRTEPVPAHHLCVELYGLLKVRHGDADV